MAAMTDITDILDTFDLLGDWEQRYQYLVELGERLPPMAEADRSEANRVKPCMSQVWVATAVDPDGLGTVRMTGDCDTAIIKGVRRHLRHRGEDPRAGAAAGRRGALRRRRSLSRRDQALGYSIPS